MKIGILPAILLICAGCSELGEMQTTRARINTFDAGRESWQIYDYTGGSGNQNVFYLTSWEERGGVGDSGYVWADDSRWRIDTPEDPHSILPLILYHRWIAEDLEEGASTTPRPTGFREEEALDLRGARVSVHLRGGDLDLKGAQCYFWVHSRGTRWHYTGRPLKIHHGEWGPPEHLVLVNDESLWHRSWAPSGSLPGRAAQEQRQLRLLLRGVLGGGDGQALHGPVRAPSGESVAETFAFQEDSDPNGHRMQ